MPEYRRWYVPGGTVFLTIVTYDRIPLFSDAANVDRLRLTLAAVRTEWPFDIPGAVVLPDHLHFLWALPAGDADYPKRVGRMKALFTRGSAEAGDRRAALTPSRTRRHERAVWQRRYIEHTIRDEDDFAAHLDYIHYNPVRHGLAARPGDWPWSSFHEWVKRGAYPADWGRGVDEVRMGRVASAAEE